MKDEMNIADSITPHSWQENARPHSGGQRGSALLAVMWIIALLSFLIGSTLVFLQKDIEGIDTRRQMFRARMLAEQGLAIAAHPDVKPDADMALLTYQVAPGEGWKVSVTGEDGRINPNKLLQMGDRNTLRRIVQAWGANAIEAENIISALIDWTDQDSFMTNNMSAEKPFYTALGMPGAPSNRPFRSIEEMAQVRYMDIVERTYPRWREWFSMYANGQIDLNSASAEVLSVMTGANPISAQRFVSQRNGRDGIPHTQDDQVFQDVQSALRVLGVTQVGAGGGVQFTVQSSISRIESTGTAGDFSRTVWVVVNRPTSVTPGGATSGISTILDMGEEDARDRQSSATGRSPPLR
jgi:general secretion pathway protein K